MTAIDAVAKLDSGSGITIMSAGNANKLQAAFPDDVQVVGGMAHPEKLKVADCRVLVVQERSSPVRIALHTSWGFSHDGRRRCCHSRQPNFEAAGHRCR